MMMEEYLAFVDIIGTSSDGEYIYEFSFTEDRETAWGDFFNVSPSANVPNISIDKNYISSKVRITYPFIMNLARKSYCFSMQDCIDGILPLCFTDLSDSTIPEYDGKPLMFMYGEDKESVINKIEKTSESTIEYKKKESGDDVIDNLIKKLKDGE